MLLLLSFRKSIDYTQIILEGGIFVSKKYNIIDFLKIKTA